MAKKSYKNLYLQSEANLKNALDQSAYYQSAFYELAKLLGDTGINIINSMPEGTEPFPVDKLVYKMLLYGLELNQRIVGLNADVMPIVNGFQQLTIKGRPIVLKD